MLKAALTVLVILAMVVSLAPAMFSPMIFDSGPPTRAGLVLLGSLLVFPVLCLVSLVLVHAFRLSMGWFGLPLLCVPVGLVAFLFFPLIRR